MNNQMNHPCDDLLQQWQARREEANFYFTALLRLSPDSSDALRRRQELNERCLMPSCHGNKSMISSRAVIKNTVKEINVRVLVISS